MHSSVFVIDIIRDPDFTFLIIHYNVTVTIKQITLRFIYTFHRVLKYKRMHLVDESPLAGDYNKFLEMILIPQLRCLRDINDNDGAKQ